MEAIEYTNELNELADDIEAQIERQHSKGSDCIVLRTNEAADLVDAIRNGHVIIGVLRGEIKEAQKGRARYEMLRCCDRHTVADLQARNLKGENFDSMVDAMVANKTRTLFDGT